METVNRGILFGFFSGLFSQKLEFRFESISEGAIDGHNIQYISIGLHASMERHLLERRRKDIVDDKVVPT